MRIFITCILLAASNGCNGASTGDHDAGEPPHWSAGIYTTDYPNGMRTWLRVVAPDRVEQVALADTVLAMERSDAGTVWARVPRDQPEGLTELVVRGEAADQVSRSHFWLLESGVYQWSTFFIGTIDECGLVRADADRIVAVCSGGNVLDTIRFERGSTGPSITARQYWLYYRYTASGLTTMATRLDLPLVATFTAVALSGPGPEFSHTAVKEVAIETGDGQATVLRETTFPEAITSAVYWRSALGTWLLATTVGGLLGWPLDTDSRLPLDLHQPLRFGSPVDPIGKVTAADTDRDGQDELFVTGVGGHGVAVYEGPSPERMVLTAQTLDAPSLAGVDLRQYVPSLADLDGDGLTDAVILGNGAVDVLWREPGGAWTVDRSTFTPQGRDVILEGPVSAGHFGRAGTPSIFVESGSRGGMSGWLFTVEARRRGQLRNFDWGAVRGTAQRPYMVADLDFDGMNDVMVGASTNRVGLWRESAEHVDRHGPDLPDVVIMEIEDIAVADGGP